ncbi:MAG: 2,3-bisphosphoglycerate-independent phosphoglycerate mutase [Magnetococcales bacterium]|nr:2,3-bisphosphoglycerate-independent phosphoglycerate mutase [Magnetococcales bacterium]
MNREQPGLMVILDGLGDRPVAELAGQTPLEAALTPHLDQLAEQGLTGLVDPIAPGIAVSTDVGVGQLMGFFPSMAKVPARGVVEAAGIGWPLQAGDVALRCNFATVQLQDLAQKSSDRPALGDPSTERPSSNPWRIIDRRAGRIQPPDTVALAETLNREMGVWQGIGVRIKAATGHRAVMLLRGKGLSADITDADPGAGGEGAGVLACLPQPGKSTEASWKAAEAVNQFVKRSFDLLWDHPINRRRLEEGLLPGNILLPRKAGGAWSGRGVLGSLGLKGAVVAGERTVIGLGRLLGFKVLTDARFTGGIKTDLEAKVKMALVALKTHDLVFLHIKGPDLFAHDGHPLGKKKVIEQIDQALAPLVRISGKACIAIAADHTTPSATGRHSGDPVPVILVSPNQPGDGVSLYGERACRDGGLGRLAAHGFLQRLLSTMGVNSLNLQEKKLFTTRLKE